MEQQPLNSDSMRTLKIKTLSDTVYELSVPASMPIKELKQKVEALSTIPTDKQRMICMGKQLQDDQTVGTYAKEETTWIHLVAKAPAPPTDTTPAAAAASTATATSNTFQSGPPPPPQPPRGSFDMLGGNMQIQQGSIGDISQMFGNITSMLGLNLPNPPASSTTFSTTIVPPQQFQIPSTHQQTTNQNVNNGQQAPRQTVQVTTTTGQSNLLQNNAPIIINRQVQLPHQELLNLGNICNTLMGADSSFPGPPLPVLPFQRNPAQLIGSYLSNWQFQVQRLLPYVHRLSELLQREPHMNIQQDREETNTLSLQIGSALNELVACSAPMVPHLRDIQLNSAPGLARFGFQQPSNNNTNNQQNQPSQVPPSSATQQQPLQQALNPLSQLINQLGGGNTAAVIRMEFNNQEIPLPQQTTNQPNAQNAPQPQQPVASQQTTQLNDSNNGQVPPTLTAAGGVDLSNLLGGLLSGLGGNGSISGNAASGILSAVNNAINQNNRAANQPANNAPTSTTETSSSSSVATNSATTIAASTSTTATVDQSSTTAATSTNTVPPNPVASSSSQSVNQHEEAISVPQQQAPQMPNIMQMMQGNPLAMLMGGGGAGGQNMLGGMMNMTLNELGDSEFEEDDPMQVFLNIVGDVRISEVMSSVMSGRFDVLDRIQPQMRNEIQIQELDRAQFTERLSAYIASLFVVPEEHEDMVFEGLDTNAIALEILESRLSVFYDLIQRDFEVGSTEQFSSEFIFEFKQLIGELFSGLAECLQRGIVDLEIVFKKQINATLNRFVGQEFGMMAGMLVFPMIWGKVKEYVLTYQQEQERKRTQMEEEQKQDASEQQAVAQETEIDLLEDIENTIEKDTARFDRYADLEFSEEYKNGTILGNQKPQ